MAEMPKLAVIKWTPCIACKHSGKAGLGLHVAVSPHQQHDRLLPSPQKTQHGIWQSPFGPTELPGCDTAYRLSHALWQHFQTWSQAQMTKQSQLPAESHPQHTEARSPKQWDTHCRGRQKPLLHAVLQGAMHTAAQGSCHSTMTAWPCFGCTWMTVLVLAGILLIVCLVAGVVLCSEFV